MKTLSEIQGFVLSYLDLHPLNYKFLVPPYIAEFEFLDLVRDGIFPTFKGFYPANAHIHMGHYTHGS